MLKRVLVSDLITEGHRLLEALKRNRFVVTAAAWCYVPESMEWRLVIVSPTVDRSGPMAAYTRIQRVLAGIKPSHLTLTDIAVVSPSNEDFQNLRAIVSSPGRWGTGSEAGPPRNIVFEENYVYQV